MSLIPNYPKALNDEHSSWHMNRPIPMGEHGSGFDFLTFHHHFLEDFRNCPGSSAKSGLWPRQRPENQFFQRKFAYRPPLRGGTWAPSRGTWAVTALALNGMVGSGTGVSILFRPNPHHQFLARDPCNNAAPRRSAARRVKIDSRLPPYPPSFYLPIILV